jgi:hypothetical protein
LLDVGAGRDEQLDHARVSITRCQHECSPPATELAGASDGMPAIALGPTHPWRRRQRWRQ